METFKTPPKALLSPSTPMNTISACFRTRLSFFNYTKVLPFCSSSSNSANTHELIHSKNCSRRRVLNDSFRVNVKVSNAAELKEKWLASLSCRVPGKIEESSSSEPTSNGDGLEWVIGIDPDTSGALALLKSDDSGYSAQVFDNPYVQVLVGKRVRKRLDANAIVQMLQKFDAPFGTTAYIEQSIPFPQDGKLVHFVCCGHEETSQHLPWDCSSAKSIILGLHRELGLSIANCITPCDLLYNGTHQGISHHWEYCSGRHCLMHFSGPCVWKGMQGYLMKRKSHQTWSVMGSSPCCGNGLDCIS